jgi:hypothetical protein
MFSMMPFPLTQPFFASSGASAKIPTSIARSAVPAMVSHRFLICSGDSPATKAFLFFCKFEACCA